MSSRSTTIIGGPSREHAWIDAATNALLVKVVNPGGGGGSSVQYNEDTAHVSGDTGTLALVVRKDTPGSLVSADGDYAALQVDSTGALRVTGGGGGTQYQEDAAHTTGDTGTLALVVRNDTPGTLAGTDGDYAALQVDGTGRLRVSVDASVAVAVTDGGGSLTVDGSVSVSNFPSVYPVNDNGGSLTVDGTLAVTQSGAWAVSVDDGGGSLTVDGTVAVSNFPSVYPVNDNGGSLTVDGTVAVSSIGGTVAVTQSTSPWVVGQSTHANLNATVRLQDRDDSQLLSVLVIDSSSVFPMTDTGIVPLVYVTDSPEAVAGDWSAIRMNEAGMVYVTVGGGSVTVTQGTSPWVVGDGGGSLTVDGTVAVSNFPSVYPVNDNGGSLTVDGTVAVSSVGGTVTVGGTVAVSSVVPGTGATNLGKSEDTAHTTGDVGVMALAVRNDTDADLSSTSGDYTPLQVNSIGRLKVQSIIESGDLSGNLADVYEGTQPVISRSKGLAPMCEVTDAPVLGVIGVWSHPFIDVNTGGLMTHIVGGLSGVNLDSSRSEDSAHATGNIGQFVLAVRNDTPSALAGTNGDYIPFTTDNTGRLYVNCNTHAVTQSGTWNIGTVTPGSGATNLGKAEDAAHASGDIGVMSLVVRRDTLVASAGTTGDYSPMAVDALGALWVRNADMATVVLSGSTRGRPIQITGTSSGAANTLHTATTTAGQLDRVFIWLTNTSASAVTVTIEFGTTGTGNELNIIVPAKETVLAVDGAVIGGAATDTIKAYAGTGSVVNAFGRVERLAA